MWGPSCVLAQDRCPFSFPLGQTPLSPWPPLPCSFLGLFHPWWPFWDLLSGPHTWHFTMWYLVTSGWLIISFSSQLYTFDVFVSLVVSRSDSLLDSCWIGQGMGRKPPGNLDVLFKGKMLLLSLCLLMS